MYIFVAPQKVLITTSITYTFSSVSLQSFSTVPSSSWKPSPFSCLVSDTLIALFESKNISPAQAEQKLCEWGARSVRVCKEMSGEPDQSGYVKRWRRRMETQLCNGCVSWRVLGLVVDVTKLGRVLLGLFRNSSLLLLAVYSTSLCKNPGSFFYSSLIYCLAIG